MPQITINNFLGGIAPSDRLGKEGSYYSGKATDPTREIGYLQPGFAQAQLAKSTDSPQVLSKYINSTTIDPKNSKLYLIENWTELHQATLAGVLVDNDPTTYPHTIGDNVTGHGGHTTHSGEDVIIYPIGTTHYLFYSWNDSVDGDVGKAALTGAPGFEDDNLSNTITSGAVLRKDVPHPMLEWQENGMLYIANGKDLVEIDGQTGANGTADMTSFSLPEGWVVTALFPAGDLIGICATYVPGSFTWNRRARCAVFFWDGSSTKWAKKVLIPDSQIRAAINLNGEYYIFTYDSTFSRGLIRKWDGTRFALEQVIRDNVSTTVACPLTFGCVDEYKNCILFSVGDYARLHLYGSPEPGLPKGLYSIAIPEGTGANLYGYAVVNSDGNIIFSSYDYTSSGPYYLTKYSSGYEKDFLYKSLYYEFNQKIRINYVRLYFKTLTSGADDDIKIETNYGDTTTTLGSISYAADGAIEYKRFNKILTCHNFRVIIDTDEANSTTGIQYSKIIVDYDFIGDDD